MTTTQYPKLGTAIGACLGSCRRAAATAILLAIAATHSASAQPVAWPVAGRQGMIQVVIVPVDQARDRDAYIKQIGLLCEPQMSCFINFFTNSTGAPVSLPLSDAIDEQPTALFRRSTKQGGEFFRWSCRMAMAEGDCF
jgi:hypothetical protein